MQEERERQTTRSVDALLQRSDTNLEHEQLKAGQLQNFYCDLDQARRRFRSAAGNCTISIQLTQLSLSLSALTQTRLCSDAILGMRAIRIVACAHCEQQSSTSTRRSLGPPTQAQAQPKTTISRLEDHRVSLHCANPLCVSCSRSCSVSAVPGS